jgi:hypothetical protein
MEKDQDRFLTMEIGRSMRFFLNASFILISLFVVFCLFAPQEVTSENLVIALIPVLLALFFFLAFLRLLKLIESIAAEEKDILLTSRIIWEYNKSWIIRAVTGKTKTFIEEGKEKVELGR